MVVKVETFVLNINELGYFLRPNVGIQDLKKGSEAP